MISFLRKQLKWSVNGDIYLDACVSLWRWRETFWCDIFKVVFSIIFAPSAVLLLSLCSNVTAYIITKIFTLLARNIIIIVFILLLFAHFYLKKVNIMFIFGQNSRIALLDPSPSGDSETENSPHEKKLGLRESFEQTRKQRGFKILTLCYWSQLYTTESNVQ